MLYSSIRKSLERRYIYAKGEKPIIFTQTKCDADKVVHYEISNDPETFVHRSGRAGKAGIAILMYSGNQVRTMKQIERDVGCRFDKVPPPNVDEALVASSEQARGYQKDSPLII